MQYSRNLRPACRYLRTCVPHASRPAAQALMALCIATAAGQYLDIAAVQHDAGAVVSVMAATPPAGAKRAVDLMLPQPLATTTADSRRSARDALRTASYSYSSDNPRSRAVPARYSAGTAMRSGTSAAAPTPKTPQHTLVF